MGHSDIGVTLNTYTHLEFEDIQKEMKQVCDSELLSCIWHIVLQPILQLLGENLCQIILRYASYKENEML